ncbi:MAG: MBL fold metallo-hydrolase [Bacteroidetes bacterium GWE2_29_8]|nr:MAG: MBL fold metallo-hydrolase [Bacteroidetes bacterium GWE2_29_8]OFY25229.1 MAG: MBL fold metallo-hydrolase [Bacteroidetes bacterium GWF2_29_10]
MYIAVTIIIIFSTVAILILQQAKFGKLPSGKRLERIKKSPNYKNGSFQNQSFTPIMAEDVSYLSVAKEFIFGKRDRIKPIESIPSIKTDLIHLDKNKDILVWFGHSSYFIQIDGKRILVDPVLSDHASPFSFSIKAFKGTNPYSTDDIPEIDYLFISHDHWDHLDYETIKKLKPKIKKIICALGIGEHFEYWGFCKDSIIEMDWNEHVTLDSGFVVNATPARHFSGRGLKRNKTLWTSFVFQTPTMKIFMSGDGGYDKHFAEIGKTFGPIDLAIFENGQYNKNWKYIHLLPDDLLKAFYDLNAKRLFSIHSSKFALGNHSWDEPFMKISANSKELNIPLITPMIGEQVNLKDTTQKFSEWWQNIK